MKKTIILSAFAFCLSLGAKATITDVPEVEPEMEATADVDAQNPDAAEKITLRDITDGRFSPQYIYGVTPMADGESYSQLSPDGRQIIRSSFKTGKQIGVIFDVDNVRSDVRLKSIDGYIMSPDEKHILIKTQTKKIYRRTDTAVYYIYDALNNKMEPLSEGGPQTSPLFSPDGNVIAFARAGNLFLVKLLYGNAESQVTTDGKPGEIINGIPDWVNEEEFSTNRSFVFSADSKVLCWIRYDESRVPLYEMQMWKGQYPRHDENDLYPHDYTYKYPIAGQQNSTVTVQRFDIKSRVQRQLEVPLDADGYIPRIVTTSDPEKIAVVTLNRHQDRMNLYMVNPLSGVAKLALQEKNDKYLRESAYTDLTFYPDGFAMLSERTGYQHLYWYNLNGQLLRTVTKGNYEVSDFYGYDPKTQAFYYASHEESPLKKAVYCAAGNGKVTRLSTESGQNSATFSTGCKYFMNVYSNLTTPPVTTLRDNTGKRLATLVDNADLKAKADKVIGQRQLFSFTTQDGVELNGWMVLPRDFDPSRQYPVIMYQYSGPGSQEVQDGWGNGFYGGCTFESYMAQQGYICACVDGRGTGARGAEFEKCTYLRLGDLESHDQVEAALWLGRQPYVDKDRIGIWGWSFGGFNTLMSMSEGRRAFRCGVAVAAPSNWRYYDTVYTERYMRTPQENDNYNTISPIGRATQLSGDLLLIHGTADDNVHFRNCTEVSEAYVQADKQFEMQVYTNRNHSIYGGNTRYHLLTRMVNFFNAKLQ